MIGCIDIIIAMYFIIIQVYCLYHVISELQMNLYELSQL